MATPQQPDIGHYRITSKLGEGGMGEVWRATDTRLNREVAIKVLPAAVAGDAMRLARFTREAQVLASLNHPNIAAIYGVEERALVMELVEGPTLAERIQGGAMALDEVLPIARQLADALAYAHDKGVIHRDLKPANIKVTPEATVKILDFGLAKAMSADSSASGPGEAVTQSSAATLPGTVLGTAAYMAPEQARGQNVDRRGDVWAFGVVLYEMLTGDRPFGGPTVSDTLAAVLKEAPDLERVPAPARRLLRACLEKDPKRRLDSVRAGMLLLETDEEGEAADPPTSRKRASLPWVVAGLLAAVLIAVVAVWRFAAPAPPAAMHFSAVTNFAGVQTDPSLSPDGRSVAFISNRDGHYNIYVTVIGGGSLVQITKDPNLKSHPAWSPDGTTIAYARLDHSGIWDIWEAPALGGTPRRVILNAADPAWSPGGHALAYENMAPDAFGALWMSGISGEDAHQVGAAAIPGWSDTQPRFSPDGRSLAFALRPNTGGPYGELAVVELASGKARLLTHDNALALSPAWSPEGRSIYFASSRGGTLNIWEIGADGGGLRQITAGEGDDAELDISADGKRIVFATLRQNVSLAQLDLQAMPGPQRVQSLTTDAVRNEMSPTYSPDGTHLAYFTNFKGIEREGVEVADADGANAVALAQDAQINIFPEWAPDSKGIIYVSENYTAPLVNWEFRRISVSGGAPQTLLAKDIAGPPDVGRDGRLLFVDTQGQAAALDPRDGKIQTLGSLPHANLEFPVVLWSPDENSVAYVAAPSREDDSNAGVWVDDFKHPPRQIFRGWVATSSFAHGPAHGPNDGIYLLEGKPDLNGVMWKVNWDGEGLTRTSWSLPIIGDFNYLSTNLTTMFSPSPNGRYLAFTAEPVSEGHIGMIENAR